MSAPASAPAREAEFVLPAPSATLDLAMEEGAPIGVHRHGNPTGPRVVLSHGNGFASDAYFPFWRLMLERFDLALFDFRNYGRNPFHGADRHNYAQFARDSAAIHRAIARAWGAKTTIGAFHSMAGTTALLAAVDGVWHWDALVLFDPPVTPPEGHPLRAPLDAEGKALFDAANIRKERFADPDELAAAFRSLYRFRRLRPGAAELAARTSLRAEPGSGGWRLCCPGRIEAEVYLAVGGLPIWQKAGKPARALLIVGADPEPGDAPKTARCCEAFCREHGIDYRFVPDTGHLMQLEEPERCFALFETFLADNGLTA